MCEEDSHGGTGSQVLHAAEQASEARPPDLHIVFSISQRNNRQTLERTTPEEAPEEEVKANLQLSLRPWR